MRERERERERVNEREGEREFRFVFPPFCFFFVFCLFVETTRGTFFIGEGERESESLEFFLCFEKK